MSTAVLELPQDLDIQDGEVFVFEIRGVAKGGRLVVDSLEKKPLCSGPPPPGPERQAAVDHFLAKWGGAFGKSFTDDELDELRWQAVKEKHGL